MTYVLDMFAGAVTALTGWTSGAIAAILLVWLVRRSAMHAVFLYGRVETSIPKTDPPVPMQGPTATYTFILQNLENEPFERFSLRLKPLCGSRALHAGNLKIFAGPKSIAMNQWKCADESPPAGLEVCAPVLPAFDTWTIVIQAEIGEIELQVGPEQKLQTALKRVILDVRPKTLRLDAADVRRNLAGKRTTPNRFHRVLAVATAVLSYLSIVQFVQASSWGQTAHMPQMGAADIVIAAALGLVVWWAAKWMERPIYPVIKGYMAETRIIGDPQQLSAKQG
jgi:hypothetical protein